MALKTLTFIKIQMQLGAMAKKQKQTTENERLPYR